MASCCQFGYSCSGRSSAPRSNSIGPQNALLCAGRQPRNRCPIGSLVSSTRISDRGEGRHKCARNSGTEHRQGVLRLLGRQAEHRGVGAEVVDRGDSGARGLPGKAVHGLGRSHDQQALLFGVQRARVDAADHGSRGADRGRTGAGRGPGCGRWPGRSAQRSRATMPLTDRPYRIRPARRPSGAITDQHPLPFSSPCPSRPDAAYSPATIPRGAASASSALPVTLPARVGQASTRSCAATSTWASLARNLVPAFSLPCACCRT
jgi:hypothetical protein